MHQIKIIVVLFLLCFFGFSFYCTAEEPVYSKKETLYSTKNGSAIGDLLLSIVPKSANANNNEWYLIIGDKSNKFFDSRTERTLWIFNKKLNANSFKKDMRNRDYPVEVKGLSDFTPFCENGIRFNIKDWEELSKQTQVSFFINASIGQKVTLRLVFYTSYQDKKRTTIDDEAKVKIEFVVPDPVVVAKQIKEAELISLTEKIDYEATAKQREAQREDSILQAEAANKKQRTALLNSFITDRNSDIALLQEEVNELLADKNTKVEESIIDSLETVSEEMKKRVDFWENVYSDILLIEESIHDKFTKFRIKHTVTSKKIEELRQQQVPFSSILSFIKKNVLLSIVGGIAGLIILKILYSLGKKLMSKIKSTINKKINKMKTDAKNKMMQKPPKKSKKKGFDDDFENIDINDLAEI